MIRHNIHGEFLTENKVKYRGKWVLHGVETFGFNGDDFIQKRCYKYGKWIGSYIGSKKM